MRSSVKQRLGTSIHLCLGMALHSVEKLSGVSSGDPVLLPPFLRWSSLGLSHPHKHCSSNNVHGEEVKSKILILNLTLLDVVILVCSYCHRCHLILILMVVKH